MCYGGSARGTDCSAKGDSDCPDALQYMVGANDGLVSFVDISDCPDGGGTCLTVIKARATSIVIVVLLAEDDLMMEILVVILKTHLIIPIVKPAMEAAEMAIFAPQMMNIYLLDVLVVKVKTDMMELQQANLISMDFVLMRMSMQRL